MTTPQFMLPHRLPNLLRSMLLWLALLAFPGLAAAAAQPCALHGHAARPALAATAAPPRMAMPLHAPMPSHAQARSRAQMPPAAPHAHRAAASPAACHDDAAQRCHGEHAHGRCSACTACCAGVAPAPAFTLLPDGPGADFVAAPFQPGHLPSVDPFLLERPPRPASA